MSKPEPKYTCYNCGEPLPPDFFEKNGVERCPQCEKFNQLLEGHSEVPATQICHEEIEELKDQLAATQICHEEIEELKDQLAAKDRIQPLRTAPRDGTYMLLFGPSGYVGTPLRCLVARYVEGYAGSGHSWRTYANDSFMDTGAGPVGWLPLPAPVIEKSIQEKWNEWLKAPAGTKIPDDVFEVLNNAIKDHPPF